MTDSPQFPTVPIDPHQYCDASEGSAELTLNLPSEPNVEDMVAVIYRVALKLEPILDQAPDVLESIGPVLEKLTSGPLGFMFGGKR